MSISQIRSKLEAIIAEINDIEAREAPPQMSATDFINHARNVCRNFQGPTPDDEKLHGFYKDTGGNPALMSLLADRVSRKEEKEGEAMKSPGGYMAAILRNANRRDLLEEANRRFSDVVSEAPEFEDDDEGEVEEAPVIEQVMTATKKRLAKPVTP